MPVRKDGVLWETCAVCRYLTDGTAPLPLSRGWELTDLEYCWLDGQVVEPLEGRCAAWDEDPGTWPSVDPELLSAHEKAALLLKKGNTYHEDDGL